MGLDLRRMSHRKAPCQTMHVAGGADRQDNLINSVKTHLICDDLKPPYKGSNSQRESEGGDGMIRVEMDSSRKYICQQVTATLLSNLQEARRNTNRPEV